MAISLKSTLTGNEIFQITGDPAGDANSNATAQAIADLAPSATGLEALDETNGLGWRLIGRNPANFGNIGLGAIDFSTSTTASAVKGATAEGSVAFGRDSYSKGFHSFAAGNSYAGPGDYTTAFGRASYIGGRVAMGWGEFTTAIGERATVWGVSSSAGGVNATAWGNICSAGGENATAWGQNSVASGESSTAWGKQNTASGKQSTAWGLGNIASGTYATAWGRQNTASGGFGATAFGADTTSSGYYSTAWGSNTTASGYYSTAWGQTTVASGQQSTVWGLGNTANSVRATVFGSFATVGVGQNLTAFVPTDELVKIGNGTSTGARSDAFLILKNGTITAPSLTDTLINTAGNKALITKEYADNSYAPALIQKAATYTLLTTDYTVECTGGTFQIDLPTAVGITGKIFNIKNSGSGTITVDANGAETIDGSLTKLLAQYDNLQIQSNGTNWIIL